MKITIVDVEDKNEYSYDYVKENPGKYQYISHPDNYVVNFGTICLMFNKTQNVIYPFTDGQKIYKFRKTNDIINIEI